MIKDILVPMLAGGFPECALRTACAIARANQARVNALIGVSLMAPNAADWAYVPEGLYAALEESATSSMQAMRARIERRLAGQDIEYDIRDCSSAWLSPAEMTTVGARYADLVVLGRNGHRSGLERRVFGGLLTAGGRPVLLVPEGTALRDGFTHVVVAWKQSPEASRALHDALPLLRQAQRVDLLVIEEEGGHPARDHEARLVAHLERHGIRARFVGRDLDDLPVSLNILDHAADSHADLIVAGGFSHARALQQAFGGVTRTLYAHASRPVLFSH